MRDPLPENSDRYRDVAQAPVGYVDVTVPRFDESLEAGAEWKLDPAANVEAKAVLTRRATAGDINVGPVESGAADHVRREADTRKLVYEVAGERRDIDVTTRILEAELIVGGLHPHRDRRV